LLVNDFIIAMIMLVRPATLVLATLSKSYRLNVYANGC